MIGSWVRSLVRRCVRPLRARQRPRSGPEYWQRRAHELGPRSVLNLGHPETEYEAVTERQKDEIFPHFLRSLRGDERLVLDLGCGPGRFTPDLAALVGGRAIGMDIVEAYLQAAPKNAQVEYRLIREGFLELSDSHVDVVWVCLVLGGIKEPALGRTAAEIVRVLKPGGLLFLAENTSDMEDAPHWAFRTFGEHQHLFPSVPLAHLSDYFDLGERISIMAGRKS